MSWRSIQLGSTLCEQDRLILDLFAGQSVRYIGDDPEFAQHLHTSDSADNLILILNQNLWLSEIVDICTNHLRNPVETFYIGLNRYCVKGNDTQYEFVVTGRHGPDLIAFLTRTVEQLGYSCTQSGHFDQDLGTHFNFVQPLTWIYGKQKTNTNQ